MYYFRNLLKLNYLILELENEKNEKFLVFFILFLNDLFSIIEYGENKYLSNMFLKF